MSGHAFDPVLPKEDIKNPEESVLVRDGAEGAHDVQRQGRERRRHRGHDGDVEGARPAETLDVDPFVLVYSRCRRG